MHDEYCCCCGSPKPKETILQRLKSIDDRLDLIEQKLHNQMTDEEKAALAAKLNATADAANQLANV